MFQGLFVNESLVVIFVLILIRVSSFLLSSSLFNSSQINPLLKILMSLVLSLVAFEANKKIQIGVEAQIITLALKEAFLGVVLGMLTRFFVVAVFSH